MSEQRKWQRLARAEVVAMDFSGACLPGSHPYSHPRGQQEIKALPPRHFAVENGFIDLLNGNVFGPDGELDRRSLTYPQRAGGAAIRDALSDAERAGAARVDAEVLDCITPSQGNFWHWHIQTLSSIAQLSAIPDASAALIVTRPLGAGFMQASLDATGADMTRFMKLPEEDILHARRIHYLSTILNPGPKLHTGHFAGTDRVAAAFRGMGRGRPLYITRRGEMRRALDNEAALEDAMRELGFAVVDTAAIPYDEQVLHALDAPVIAGTHGAGLTHLAFQAPGARLVELFSAHYVRLNFAAAAKARGLEYHAYVEADDGPGPKRHVHDFRWRITVDRVSEAMKRLLDGI